MGKTMRVREGDNVVVIAGKDRGKTGRVLRAEPQRRRVYVEGLNMVKRHQRPRSMKDTQRAAHARLLACDGGQLLPRRLEHFGVLLGHAHAHVEGDLLDQRRLHQRGVAEARHERGSDLLQIAGLQTSRRSRCADRV